MRRAHRRATLRDLMARSLASSRRRTLFFAVLIVAFAALLVAAPVFALAMAPAIALFALLAQNVMPGEERLTRLLARRLPRRRRTSSVALGYRVVVVRRVGRRLAVALAMRPPPAPQLSH
jgi:hypothetical protein